MAHKNPQTDAFAAIAFFLALMFFIFLAGWVSGNYAVEPGPTLDGAMTALNDEAKMLYDKHTRTPTKHLIRQTGKDKGVTVPVGENSIIDKDAVTLITTLYRNDNAGNPPARWSHVIRLMDMQGKLVHQWPVDPFALFGGQTNPDPRHMYWHDKYNTFINDAVLMDNGDVVFNLEYLGLARLGPCGTLRWTWAHPVHHVLHLNTDDGTLWTSGRYWRNEAIKDYPGLVPPFVDETVVQINPVTGNIIQEFSILDVLYNAGYEGLLFANKSSVPILDAPDGDMTHINNVDILPKRLAGAFPMFEAGDIMVSIRNINTVMVLDSQSLAVKWSITHPFVRQHDPDFTANGKITVFDNRRDDTSTGRIFTGSRIVSINPATNDVEEIYKKPGFYTNIMGELEHRPNGNMLVVSSNQGRVFEINPQGKTLWEYVNRWNKTYVAQIAKAARYPAHVGKKYRNITCPAAHK